MNPNKFYGFYEGKLYVSTDSGATFTATAATGLPANNVNGLQPSQAQVSLKAMPGVEGDIWFAGGHPQDKYGIWHSTNSGASFTKLSNVEEADLIGFGKAAPGENYMALYTVAQIDGVRGVFRSDDAGASWVRINDDNHQYARINMAITGDPRVYGRVYLGTNGRGTLYADPVNPPAAGSVITPVTASFDKKTGNQSDVEVAMTLNGNTLDSITNGATALTAGTDYTVSGSTVTIHKAYLAAQPIGATTLTFHFSAGAAKTLTVTVADTTSTANDSTLTPVTASFDKKTGNQSDIEIAMTLNGNTLTSIKNGPAVLTAGTDYTVSGSVVTIRKAYLAAQAVGTTTLSFQFSAGAPQSLAVMVTDTTTPVDGGLKVQMFNSSTVNAVNALCPRIKLVNTGTAAVSLADVKLRYYYTSDGEQAQNFFCDWSQVGSANVTGTFVKLPAALSGADHYLELGFTAAAGSLAPGASIDIQMRASKADWSNYSQTGDYSFNPAGTAPADWAKLPAYISGSLVWGLSLCRMNGSPCTIAWAASF